MMCSGWYVHMYTYTIINPLLMYRRVTVVVLSVYLSVIAIILYVQVLITAGQVWY